LISYTYDEFGRLHTATQNSTTVTYDYNAVGSLETVLYGNGIHATYNYNALNRLDTLVWKNAAETTIASYDYDCYADGQRAKVTELDGTVTQWSYDNLNRLVQENRVGSYTHDYTYDLVGNRVKLVSGTTTTYYQYNEMDQLLAESPNPDYTNPTITYGYDENGSLTSKTVSGQTTVYGYNLQNRMASVTIGTNPAINYTYNPDGIRVSAGNTSYLIDPYNSTGYSQVFRETTGSTTTVYAIGNDILTQAVSTAQPQYFLYDGHGSVRKLMDSNGNLITGQEYNYDAYGNLFNSPSPQTSLLYVGEMWDVNLNWYYDRARWYLPQVGLFNRFDPCSGSNSNPQSLHKYLYAHCNPVNNLDPSGEMTVTEVTVVVTIVGGVLGIIHPALHSAKDYYQENLSAMDPYDQPQAITYLGSGLDEQYSRDMLEISDPDLRGMTESFWYDLGENNQVVAYQKQLAEKRVVDALDMSYHAVEGAGLALAVAAPITGLTSGTKLIIGAPHGSDPHWQAMLEFATHRQVIGEANTIYTHRGLSTITNGAVKTRLFPDVCEVMPSGKLRISQFLYSETPAAAAEKERQFRAALGSLLESYVKIQVP
jgi:RHS repeat-associated protein